MCCGVAPLEGYGPLEWVCFERTLPECGIQQVISSCPLACAVAPLEGYGPHEWVCFERALVVRDLFTGGTRTFHSSPDAQDFRAALYQQYGATRG